MVHRAISRWNHRSVAAGCALFMSACTCGTLPLGFSGENAPDDSGPGGGSGGAGGGDNLEGPGGGSGGSGGQGGTAGAGGFGGGEGGAGGSGGFGGSGGAGGFGGFAGAGGAGGEGGEGGEGGTGGLGGSGGGGAGGTGGAAGADAGAACGAAGECPEGYECRGEVCVPDLTAPTVTAAYTPAANRVRVAFSEPMATGPLSSTSSYCIEVFDGQPGTCSATFDFGITSATPLGAAGVELALSANAQARLYTVIVTGVGDLAGNPIGTPNYAEFDPSAQLRVSAATATSTTSVLVTFSKPLRAGPDTAGSAGCTSPSQCAGRYRIIGPTSTGAIASAQVLPWPHDDQVLVSHGTPQGGGTYTIIAANGLDGDGFDDAAWGSITTATGTEGVQAVPNDRALFNGRGAAVSTFADGPLLVDPFGDGSTFSYVFKYASQIYLGPNRTGTAAVRADADGSRAQSLTFAFAKDSFGEGITRNGSAAPYPSIGAPGCTPGSPSCGPDNENGRGLFASGVIDGAERLMIGGAKSSGNLDYVYSTADLDAVLNMQYVDISANTGGATRGFSAMGISSGRAYLGFPDTSGRRPYLVMLLAAPAAGAPGLETVQNGNGYQACDPAVHSACFMAADEMPGIGLNGSPPNPAGVQLIDFVAGFNDRVYLGNNGGLVRSTTASPLDFHSRPGDWVAVTPDAAEYGARVSITTAKVAAIEPADKAWPQFAVFRGRAYLGRNTTAGPQLWACDPAASGSDTDCDPGDWALIAANATGDALLTQFENSNNARISAVVATASYLYVGFDNAVDGVVVYRTGAATPASPADFEGQGGCSAATSGCPGLGGNGLGAPAGNRRLFDAVALPFGGASYLYVTTGDGVAPVRVYRNQD